MPSACGSTSCRETRLPAPRTSALGWLHLIARDCPTDLGELHPATDQTHTDVPTAADLAPFRRVRDTESAVWALGVAQSYPARYRGTARKLLATALAG